VLSGGLGALTLLGLGVMPFRVQPDVSADPVPQAPKLSRNREHIVHPLLLVGIDGGSRSTVDSVLQRGLMPTLGSFEADGMSGDMDVPWKPPYWSGAAWAAIATGSTEAETQVYEDMAAHFAGFPPFQIPLRYDPEIGPLIGAEFLGVRLAPYTRDSLKKTPVWTLVSNAGVKSAVVRWAYTYPADGQADFVVSDRVGTYLFWKALRIDLNADPAAVAPRQQASNLLSAFLPDHKPDLKGLEMLIAGAKALDQHRGNYEPAAVLAMAANIDARTIEASEQLIVDHPDISFMAVQLDGLDGISHIFWRYRFPSDFPDAPPSEAEKRALGPVIDKYWEFLDTEIGSLASAFPTAPNVIVISDHGQRTLRHDPTWSSEHDQHAIFFAAGPDVPNCGARVHLSHYDIVPTVLDLVSVSALETSHGRSLVSGSNCE
jgi:predicted AlkP superfamily phosphohydrolase/phosphomutase